VGKTMKELRRERVEGKTLISHKNWIDKSYRKRRRSLGKKHGVRGEEESSVNLAVALEIDKGTRLGFSEENQIVIGEW